MSEEPNSKMEELLRAYAKKRREQADPPLQLHPATRKFLQDEVKRTLVAAPPPARRSWRTMRWPLAAMGAGFAALLVMFAMINAQMRGLMPATAPANRDVTQTKSVHSAPASVAEGTASPAPNVSLADKSVAEYKKSPAAPPGAPPATVAGPLAAAAPTPPAQASDTPQLDAVAPGQPSSLGGTYGASRALGAPAGTAAPVAADASAPTFAAEAMKRETAQPAPASEGAGVSAGEFVQLHDGVKEQAKESPLSNVLSDFHVRRSGQNVSIVDADGSVYVGHVVNDISPRRGRGGTGSIASAGAAETRKDTKEDANWRFTVTGTNMQLQQKVIFTGSVQAMTAPGAARSSFARNRSALPAQNAPVAAPVESPLNSRITGKVQVGGGKEFEIEAKPPLP